MTGLGACSPPGRSIHAKPCYHHFKTLRSRKEDCTRTDRYRSRQAFGPFPIRAALSARRRCGALEEARLSVWQLG
jgi:hypothetical protein